MTNKTQKTDLKLEDERILHLLKKIREVQKDPNTEPRHAKQELHKLVKKNIKVLSSAFWMINLPKFLWSKSSWLKRKGLLLSAVFILLGVSYVAGVVGDWALDFIGMEVSHLIIDRIDFLVALLIFFGLLKVWIRVWMPGFLLTANGGLFVSFVMDKIHKKQDDLFKVKKKASFIRAAIPDRFLNLKLKKDKFPIGDEKKS